MKLLTFAWASLGLLLFILFPIQPQAEAQVGEAILRSEGSGAYIFMFGRDDCGFCKEQFAYLQEEGLPYTYLNIIEDEEAARLYDAVVEKHGLTKVTPITVIGETVLVGFNGARTTGVQIKNALEAAESSPIRSVEDHLALAPVQEVTMGGGCTGISCDEGDAGSSFVF